MAPERGDKGSKSTPKHTEKTDKPIPRTEKVSPGLVFFLYKQNEMFFFFLKNVSNDVYN